MDPDPYPIGICGNFAVEKAIQLFFAKKMFSTGIWVDKKYKWLATTPDALIEIETQLFPVQIKAITVKKDIMDVAKEYYTQIQLHIQVTNASKLLLIVYFKQTCLLNSVFVKRDDQFLSILLKRLEFAYLNHIPFMLFRQPTKEDIKSMIEDDRFRNTFLKLSRNDDLFESESKKPNVKHISLEAFSFSKQEVNFLSRLTFTSYLLKTTEISKRIFWEKWSSYIADDKDEWFPKKIEAVTKILRNLQSQLRQ